MSKELQAKIRDLLWQRRRERFGEDDDAYETHPRLLDELAKWTYKWCKKAPFYLYSKKPKRLSRWIEETDEVEYYYDGNIFKYGLIYKDGEKVKFGYFEDDMYARYGSDVVGHITSASPIDLWQRRKGLVTPEMYEAMVAVYEGRSELPEFDFLDINVRCH